MRIADVVGTVTLNSVHPSLVGASFKLVTPLSWDDLAGRWRRAAGGDCRVATNWGRASAAASPSSEGREAAMPFHPEVKPVDAYNAAILDTLGLRAVGHHRSEQYDA